MPSMANLTVKKADETTNIVYDALTPAAGDASDAVWRQDTGAVAGMPVGHRAILKMRTMNNGTSTARRAVVTFTRPYSTQNTTTSKYEAKDSVVGRLEITVPQAIPATEVNEAVYQFLNCLGLTSGLIKQSIAAGYAPA
jgi:hypothetical protein